MGPPHRRRRVLPVQSTIPRADFAELITSVVDCESDPTTLAAWGKASRPAVSVASLRARCVLAGVRAKDALCFTRLLRALHLSRDGAWSPADFLDISDPRTLRRMLSRGGMKANSFHRRGIDPAMFVYDQRLVNNHAVIVEVAEILTALKGQ